MTLLRWVRTRTRLSGAFAAGACAAATTWVAVPAGAANIFEDVGSAFEFRLDPSVRSQAMGGASGAVFWGTSPNYWANPALLGLTEGVTYENRSTQDIDFSAARWTVGRGGVGLATAGHPFTSLGGLELSPWDEIRSWGIGASVSSIASSVAGLLHREAPGFTRYADLAIGYNRKSSEWDLGLPGIEFTALGVDWGVLARGRAPLRLGGEIPSRLEAAYAYSVQNANDVSRTGALGPADRARRHGVALRLGLDLPASWRDQMPSWLAPGFEPLVSLGGAWDRQFISIGSGLFGGMRATWAGSWASATWRSCVSDSSSSATRGGTALRSRSDETVVSSTTRSGS